jgi:hypothetical protein
MKNILVVINGRLDTTKEEIIGKHTIKNYPK